MRSRPLARCGREGNLHAHAGPTQVGGRETCVVSPCAFRPHSRRARSPKASRGWPVRSHARFRRAAQPSSVESSQVRSIQQLLSIQLAVRSVALLMVEAISHNRLNNGFCKEELSEEKSLQLEKRRWYTHRNSDCGDVRPARSPFHSSRSAGALLVGPSLLAFIAGLVQKLVRICPPVAAATVTALAPASTVGQNQVPEAIGFQGVLSLDGRVIEQEGPFELRFRILDVSGHSEAFFRTRAPLR